MNATHAMREVRTVRQAPDWTAETFHDPGVVLFIDKPLDWTSYQVVRKIRGLFNVRKAGHAGTLDPKATGLLIVCTGKMTRSIASFMDQAKEYRATIQMGITTPSFDLETEVIERRTISGVTREAVDAAASGFVGAIEQTPPMYSAIKRDGRPLYHYARRGETVERTPRTVHITAFDIEAYDAPNVIARIACSKGTYIRSLADDLGRRLECGATLTALRRTKIGSHDVADAWSIQELEELARQLGIVRQRRHAHPPSA